MAASLLGLPGTRVRATGLFVVGVYGGALAGVLAGSQRSGLWRGFLVGLGQVVEAAIAGAIGGSLR